MIVNVTDANYDEQVRGVTGPLILVFGTFEDLGSRVLGPVLLAVDETLGGHVPIAVADVVGAPRAAAAWGVGDKLPVTLILRSGVLERVLHGVRSERRLVADFNEAIHS